MSREQYCGAASGGLTSPEQRELRETTLNMLGQQLERIERQLDAKYLFNDLPLEPLGAKLDTLSGQLDHIHQCMMKSKGIEQLERRIDKLGNDLRKEFKKKKKKHG